MGGSTLGGSLRIAARDLFANIFGRLADVALQDEGDHDVAPPSLTIARISSMPLTAATTFLERQDDLRHDFFRTRAGQLHADIDRRGIGPREQIHTQVDEAEDAQHHQEHDQHEREDGPLYADFRKYTKNAPKTKLM